MSRICVHILLPLHANASNYKEIMCANIFGYFIICTYDIAPLLNTTQKIIKIIGLKTIKL